MEDIILDTNFLMIPFTQNVDVFDELSNLFGRVNLYVVDKTIEELDKLSKTRSGKDKQAALLARSLLKLKGVKTLTTGNGYADDVILTIAKEKGYFVATQDRDLKVRLKKNNVPRIFLRQKKYLEVEK